MLEMQFQVVGMLRSGFLELISCRLAHCIADMKTVTVTTDVALLGYII